MNQYISGMTKRLTAVPISMAEIMAMESGFCSSLPISNVKSSGKAAFKDCKNLKNITVKSTKLKTVKAKALKGINKKATIKVPAKKLKNYQKLFRKKGQSSSVKIKK